MNSDISKVLPIVISCFSLTVSAIALGWNIYRDLILRARLKVSFNISKLVTRGQKEQPTYALLAATNWGPGEIICNMISFKYRPLFVLSKVDYEQGIIIHDYENPLNEKLPKKLQVGETIQHLFPYKKDIFLNGKITHIGFIDSFGRQHFAPAKYIKKAVKTFKKDFNLK